MENVQRTEDYKQVCVWPGVLINNDVNGFTDFMKQHCNVRVVYLEEIKTAPDMHNGCPVAGTGGRNDVLFAVHNDDVGYFAIPRLTMGVRWVEDVLDNEEDHSIYPAHIKEYRTW